MEIPIKIGSVISRINQSEDRWKAVYMAVWGYYFQIRDKFENTPYWNKPLKFGLPAFPKGFHPYTPSELCSILTSKDEGITFEHLITIFSLFEELLSESSKILCSEEIDASKKQEIKKFFEENRDLISDPELKELLLAKETRNCYIHKNGTIDEKWIEAYKEARGSSSASKGEGLEVGFSSLFHQIDKWHELIVNLSQKIENKIKFSVKKVG